MSEVQSRESEYISDNLEPLWEITFGVSLEPVGKLQELKSSSLVVFSLASEDNLKQLKIF